MARRGLPDGKPVPIITVRDLDNESGAVPDSPAPFVEEVEAALRAANGKAQAHAITRYSEVLALVYRVEEMLRKRGVPKGLRAGTTLDYRPAGGNSHYPNITTRLVIQRNTIMWSLVAAKADKAWPKAPESFALRVTDQAGTAIMRHALRDITVEGCSASVLRDLAFYARECWYVRGEISTNSQPGESAFIHASIKADERIVNDRVRITAYGSVGSSKSIDFALYTEDRSDLEGAMVMARLAHSETLHFDQIRKRERMQQDEAA